MPDAGPGLMQIDQHSGALRGDAFDRISDHLPALAFSGPEDIAVDAMRMHAHQDVFASRNLAVNQSQVHFGDDGAAVDDGLEVAKLSSQAAFRFPAYEAFVLQPVADQISHGDHTQLVPLAKFLELRNARH